MKRAFVSHSSANRGYVRQSLIPFLKRTGVEPWYSTDEIVGGDHWQRKITEGLESCDLVILLVSSEAAESDWVRSEITIALRLKKPVIPLLLDDTPVRRVHAQLVLRQHIDLRGDEHEAYNQLARVISTQQLPPPLPEPPTKEPEKSPAPPRKKGIRVVLAIALLIALTAAVTGVVIDWLTGSPSQIASLDVVPSDLELIIGQSSNLEAIPRDQEGEAVPDRTVRWTSTNAGVATVSSDGSVQARSSGQTVVSATCGGEVASVTVTVARQAEVRFLTIDNVATGGQPLRMFVGASLELKARLHDGDRVEVTDRRVSWAVSDLKVATITPAGRLEAHRVGEAVVTGRCEAAGVEFTVIVEPLPRCAALSIADVVSELAVGESHRLGVNLYDAKNQTLPDRPVRWASTKPAVASVGSDGFVRALAAGTAEIVATCEDGEARLTLTVVARPTVASVSILGAPSGHMDPGDTIQLRFQALMTDGSAATNRRGVWRSSDSAVAGVSSTGMVIARSAGEAEISVECAGKSRRIVVHVRAGPASVRIVTRYEEMFAGFEVTLAVIVKDNTGRQMTGRTVRWSVSDRAVATIDPSGLLQAHRPGRVVVTAECEGVRGTHVMRVVLPPPPRVRKLSFPLAMSTYELNRDGSLLAIQNAMGRQVNPPNVRATTTVSDDTRFIWRVRVDGVLWGVTRTEILYVHRDGSVYIQQADMWGNLALTKTGTATFWD